MGEIFLIFVGITLAITFENAAQIRREEKLNLGLLAGIHQSLQANVDELNGNIRVDEDILASLATTLEAFESVQVWNDSLGLLVFKRIHNRFREHNVDFADCLHVATAFTHDHLPTMSFDKQAGRVERGRYHACKFNGVRTYNRN